MWELCIRKPGLAHLAQVDIPRGGHFLAQHCTLHNTALCSPCELKSCAMQLTVQWIWMGVAVCCHGTSRTSQSESIQASKQLGSIQGPSFSVAHDETQPLQLQCKNVWELWTSSKQMNTNERWWKVLKVAGLCQKLLCIFWVGCCWMLLDMVHKAATPGWSVPGSSGMPEGEKRNGTLRNYPSNPSKDDEWNPVKHTWIQLDLSWCYPWPKRVSAFWVSKCNVPLLRSSSKPKSSWTALTNASNVQ